MLPWQRLLSEILDQFWHFVDGAEGFQDSVGVC
jgi:hypothetical protein